MDAKRLILAVEKATRALDAVAQETDTKSSSGAEVIRRVAEEIEEFAVAVAHGADGLDTCEVMISNIRDVLAAAEDWMDVEEEEIEAHEIVSGSAAPDPYDPIQERAEKDVCDDAN
jgi:tRNA threonylcarbamoyladenosine modification (KEOPS) complex Cgi121 subunit